MTNIRWTIASALCAAVLASGQPASWSEKAERTVGGPEADLLVRTGDINNFGFGWPEGFDPFLGTSTPGHGYPWTPPEGAPAGTDRIMLGSAVTPQDVATRSGDGYAGSTERAANQPEAITIEVGKLPAKIDGVLFQMFLDDFQAPLWTSRFQVSLNGTRIPSFEAAVNALEQTGPVGKLVSLRLLPEYWPLLRSGAVKLLIDDPTTHAPDGYAVDFVRILVNPHPVTRGVSLNTSVVDADTRRPIAGATVTAGYATGTTDRQGKAALTAISAGLVVATSSAPGYDESSLTIDLEAGATGNADFALRPHKETAADLARAIAENGSAALYGIHFDTNSATLRADSEPALTNVLALINTRAGSRWIIAGHTDNQGGTELNQKLSLARSAAVVAWLASHGVAAARLAPQGFGATRPVSDNATESGRALNRRVEISPAP